MITTAVLLIACTLISLEKVRQWRDQQREAFPRWRGSEGDVTRRLPWGVRPRDSYELPEVREMPLTTMPSLAFPPTPPKGGMLVPNVVHYMKWFDHESEDLAHWEYLAVRSVLMIQRPEVVYFHCNMAPTGPWWDEIAGNVTVSQVDLPQTIFGHPVWEPAHQTDIVRLIVLEKLGGMCLDLDVFLLRPLDPLLYAPATQGMQGDDYGMCMAVLISAPHAPFIQRLISSYSDFNGRRWDWNSTRRALIVARMFAEEIQVMMRRAFYEPGHGTFRQLFEGDDWEFGGEQYLFHAWHKGNHAYLKLINPHYVKTTQTSFNRYLSRYMGPNDEAIWARARGL